MPPQNPYQPTMPPGPGPVDGGQQSDPESYDFIVNPSAPQKQRAVKGVSSKLIFVAIGGVAIVIILLVYAALGSSKSQEPSLVSVAQEQTEIARVAALQTDNITDDDSKAFALNTQYSMQSAQSDYLAYLSEHGSGINSKQLGSAHNPQTDATLDSAKQNGTLDATLVTVLQDELGQYQQTIKTAYGRTHAAATHKELQTLYDQAALLIQQSKQQ